MLDEKKFEQCIIEDSHFLNLTSHLRLPASLSLSVCSLLAYPEICEQFLEKLFFCTHIKVATF